MVVDPVLVERSRQPVRSLADLLGLRHHCFSGVRAQEDEAALSGVAAMSSWPPSWWTARSVQRRCGELGM